LQGNPEAKPPQKILSECPATECKKNVAFLASDFFSYFLLYVACALGISVPGHILAKLSFLWQVARGMWKIFLALKKKCANNNKYESYQFIDENSI
jgi:hypothetical protein